MYYAHNSFTGRLIGASRLKAYAPQGIQPLHVDEPVNPYPATWAKTQVVRAPQLSTTAGPKPASASPPQSVPTTNLSLSPDGDRLPPVSDRIKRLQQKFQVPDGVPVHLKGGPVDKVLYYLTLGLCVVALGGCVQVVYKMSFPKAQSE